MAELRVYILFMLGLITYKNNVKGIIYLIEHLTGVGGWEQVR